jgi:uncharacterized protein (TIGR00251 family)
MRMDDIERLALREDEGITRLTVRVIPRAGKTGIDGVTDDGALRVRLTAPPVEGAANAALVAYLADLFELPKRDVTIVRGAQSREKMVAVSAPPARVRERLRAATAPSHRVRGSATNRG